MKFKYIFFILVALLPGFMAAPMLVRADSKPLAWSKVDLPSANGKVIVSPSEVSEIAIGSGIFYAVDAANSKVYRSRSGGANWEDKITTSLQRAGALLPVKKIALAPDSPSIVAVVDNSERAAFVSIDGGANWTDAQVPPGIVGKIQSIAVSRKYEVGNYSYRDIAIGTAEWGDVSTTGQVWIFQMGLPVTAWRNSGLRVNLIQPGVEVSSLAFSPHYADDQTIVVLASTGNATFLNLGQRDFNSGAVTWNDATSFPGYPVNVVPEGDAPGLTRIVTSLELQNSYDSTIPSARRLILFFDRQPTLLSDDLYRINDTTPTRFSTPDGSNVDISSISLQGSKLMVGMVDPLPSLVPIASVHVTSNAFSPVVTWTPISAPPSGPGNAKVAWGSGNTAYCGTGQNPSVPLDESAFSISTDGGDTWMQISLIDTQLTLQDVAAAFSPASLFMSTISPDGLESVWRSAGEPLGQFWGRVLVTDASSGKLILRISPDYESDFTVYAVEAVNPPNPSKGDVWASINRGNSWKLRHAPGPVVDFVAGSKAFVYAALPDGLLSRSSNGGLFWREPVPICISRVNMLSLYDLDIVLVGGVAGEVAITTDGGVTFVRFMQGLGTSPIGNLPVQVVADAGFKQNHIFYAGAGNVIYRRSLEGGEWEEMEKLPAERLISGMVCPEGVLYAAWFDSANPGSGAERNLEPRAPLLLLEWETINFGSEDTRFDATPSSLKYSTTPNQIMLWAIDTLHSVLMVYGDSLTRKGPISTNPDVVSCDPVSGRNQEFSLTWEQLSLATKYEIGLYKGDKETQWASFIVDFNTSDQMLKPRYTFAVAQTFAAFPFSAGASNLGGGDAAPAQSMFECGHTYWWRVRVRGSAYEPNIRSPWSAYRSFAIKAGLPVTSPVVGPLALTPANGALAVPVSGASFSWSNIVESSEYEFQLSDRADMSRSLVVTNISTSAYGYAGELRYAASYYWRVRVSAPVISDWSSVFTFMTEGAPSPPIPPPPVQASELGAIPAYAGWLMAFVGFGIPASLLFLVWKTRR